MNNFKKTMSKISDEDFEATEGLEMTSEKQTSGLMIKVVIVILVIIVLLAGLFLVSKFTSWNVLNISKTEEVTSKNWDAIFLTNGQVYFGHIVKQSSDTIEMKNIYYLQVTRQLQPTPNNQAANQEQQQLSLVKLGDELHGPTDYMNINRSQVLFTEELKEDSKVVDAIKRYNEDQENNVE